MVNIGKMEMSMKMDQMMRVVAGGVFLVIALSGRARADESAAIAAIGGPANWALLEAGEVVVQ